jgi:hypothetical protein
MPSNKSKQQITNQNSINTESSSLTASLDTPIFQYMCTYFSALSRAVDSARPRPTTRAYARATIPSTMLEGMPKAALVAAVGRARPLSAIYRPRPIYVSFWPRPHPIGFSPPQRRNESGLGEGYILERYILEFMIVTSLDLVTGMDPP